MKKTTLIFTVVLVFCFVGLAQGAVQVYYLPDSGFLKVEGKLTIEPSLGQLSFLVFPHAQITEFWVDGLKTYELERVTHGTLVTFSLRDQVQETSLNLSYEGFLPLQGEKVILDRDTLWFPEFSFPIKTSIASTEVPVEWEVVEQGLKNNYPQLIISRKRNEVETGFTEATFEGQIQVEPTLDIQTYGDQTPTQAEFLSKIQIQVSRLVNLINLRNQEGLETIIGGNLQKKGLPKYLVSVPESYGPITSEFLSSPTFIEEPFEVAFSTQKGPKFLAKMSWQEVEGIMVLESFSLTPLGQPIPPVVEESLTEFVSLLQTALKNNELQSLRSLISSDAKLEQFVEFLTSLNTNETWEIQYVALDPLNITVLVNQSKEARLLLDIGLSIGEKNWLIDTLNVIPLR